MGVLNCVRGGAKLQCWTRATFFSSRHRDMRYLLNHCATAPPQRFFLLISATAPPHHYATAPLRHRAIAPHLSENITQLSHILKKILRLNLLTSVNVPVPVVLYYSMLNCLATVSFSFLKFRYF